MILLLQQKSLFAPPEFPGGGYGQMASAGFFEQTPSPNTQALAAFSSPNVPPPTEDISQVNKSNAKIEIELNLKCILFPSR